MLLVTNFWPLNFMRIQVLPGFVHDIDRAHYHIGTHGGDDKFELPMFNSLGYGQLAIHSPFLVSERGL
jgi:hypothetical protein